MTEETPAYGPAQNRDPDTSPRVGRRAWHRLKTLPVPFDAVLSGAKRFEYRRDDRGFAVGDFVYLEEWDGTAYTGNAVVCPITYLLRVASGFGVPEGYAVLGIGAPVLYLREQARDDTRA